MAQRGGSGGFGVVLVIIVWIFLLVATPAAYVMLGPDQLLRMWHDMVGY